MKNFNLATKPIRNILLFATQIFIAANLLQSCTDGKTNFSAGNLKCEYLINPLGIDSPNPRLTWQMTDDRHGTFQYAYQILVSSDSAELSRLNGSVWNSGKIKSAKNLVSYQGNPLKPFTRYYWRVILWDQKGRKSVASKTAFFETGMIDKMNWKGSWISDSRDVKIKPAPYFRKSFNVTKKILSARQYIAVAGLYELYINGSKIGNHVLDPAYTRFDRRTLYLTHDVTTYLQQGENVIGVILGNGWYNHQSTAVWYFDEAPWRSRPKFCTDLRITYDDGSTETITSGTDWKTSLGPIIFNSIYTAEHYDARLEQPGWDKTGFNDSKWARPILVAAPSSNIVSQVMQPIRQVEEIPAASVNMINKLTAVYDLGRNIAGVSKLKVSGPGGTVIRLKHSERLYPDGRADQSNIDVHYRPTDDKDPFQTDIFILKGEGVETFMARFGYKGFQYVEVTSDKPLNLTKESLTGYFMHSDVPVSGSIESSNPVIDKIWRATNNSYLSNLYAYPTDCPQREKNGWTGDAHIASETGLYNFDGITVYEKWLADHADEQQPNGVLPAIIPTSGWGYHWANGPDWTSTIAIIPWNIYLFYGDSYLLEKYYNNIKRYVDHITEISPEGLTDWGLGDWIPIKSRASRELTSSVYYYVDAVILSKAANLLGKNEDLAKYDSLSMKIRNAINKKFLDKDKGVYASGLQTELSSPLFWGVVPDDLKQKVADRLAEKVKEDGNKLDVGLLGTKTILNALSENGYPDLAYKLASQETFPSWGWWIVNGATTLYENWPLDTKSDISMNHIMFGEIGAWLYKSPGGIYPDEMNPGFKNVILKPCFVEGLDHFSATHEGPFGNIVSSWKRAYKGIEYDVEIPANSTATIMLKGTDITLDGKKLSEHKDLKVTQDNDVHNYNLSSGK
ncbi:MAG: family 78 glycoside hydrolase catalytic domain [Bacteroidales bacterium]|nr:family 78 glycoside hydrolase catalytic domain [Bacteroidales bacterium]